MDLFIWLLISLLLVGSFVGLVYPIIPSVLFLFGAFFLYGFYFSFDVFSVWFWIVQIILFILLIGADYIANLIGTKKFGGSKAAIWGSTIGLLVGPFIIPMFGILLGPFLGAILAELIVTKQSFSQSVKIGIGSLIGLISSIFAKGLIQLIMCIYFFIVVI